MVGRLFKTGTCKKKEFFDILIAEILANGWKDVSSNPGTDFYVLQSDGEAGTKNLILQMKNWFLTSEAVGSVRDGSGNHSSFGIRFPLGYTPGEDGAAGTFTRPTTPWDIALVFPFISNANGTSVMDPDTIIDYALAVNKDNIVYVITPNIASPYNSLATFIGLADERYTAENNSDGMIYASSMGGGYAANTVLVANDCSELGSMSPDAETRATSSDLPIKNPNAAGVYMMTDMIYEEANEGVRGKINSLLFLPNINIVANDILVDGANKYKIAICQPPGAGCANSFPVSITATVLAFRIE